MWWMAVRGGIEGEGMKEKKRRMKREREKERNEERKKGVSLKTFTLKRCKYNKKMVNIRFLQVL